MVTKKSAKAVLLGPYAYDLGIQINENKTYKWVSTFGNGTWEERNGTIILNETSGIGPLVTLSQGPFVKKAKPILLQISPSGTLLLNLSTNLPRKSGKPDIVLEFKRQLGP